ncbi:MAG TPA: phosphotransferase family protein [Stellaceae bacterium]|nr:phosphotransferase family protein [Stellaceae bacterium]
MPPFEPPADFGSLVRFLAAASGAERVETGAFALLSGGAIQENWGFTALFAGGRLAGAQPLVLRTNAATGIASSLGRIEEFAVLKAAFAAGVTVPEPLFACADPSVIGKPFFVMRRVPGTAQGRQITADPALDEGLPPIASWLGHQLARLQTIRPPRPDLPFLRLIEAPQHIADFRGYLDSHPQPRPVLEWAIRWLETHLPEPLPPVLCHRDFRTGNYMLDGAQLTGILDWEFAGWGDPDEDIGWFCCKGWRFARLDREAGGIAGRAPFYAGYENAAGRRLDPERVHFWEVLANVRWAVIALQQSDRCLIGDARDLSTAIIGRRASECELELLLLLDPGGSAQTTPSPPHGPLAGERVGVRGPLPTPSPVRGLPPAATLSRIAGEGLNLRDRPSGIALLALGRELLIEELLPLLPPERHRDLRLVATAMSIAEREAMADAGPAHDIRCRLVELYGDADLVALFCRLAADLRTGAFESCAAREAAARAILWRLTIVKLREGNPVFLAENGFGE